MARRHERNRAAVQRWAALVAAVACGLVAVVLNDHRRDERTLRLANEAGAAGRLREAERLAATIDDGPVAADAWYVRATALRRLARYGPAVRAYRASLELRPNDWRVERDLAATFLTIGKRSAAKDAYARALALNPNLPRLTDFSAGDPSTRTP